MLPCNADTLTDRPAPGWHQSAALGRAADLRYTADTTLIGPARRPIAGEGVLGGYLQRAVEVIGDCPDDIGDGPAGL